MRALVTVLSDVCSLDVCGPLQLDLALICALSKTLSRHLAIRLLQALVSNADVAWLHSALLSAVHPAWLHPGTFGLAWSSSFCAPGVVTPRYFSRDRETDWRGVAWLHPALLSLVCDYAAVSCSNILCLRFRDTVSSRAPCPLSRALTLSDLKLLLPPPWCSRVLHLLLLLYPGSGIPFYPPTTLSGLKPNLLLPTPSCSQVLLSLLPTPLRASL